MSRVLICIYIYFITLPCFSQGFSAFSGDFREKNTSIVLNAQIDYLKALYNQNGHKTAMLINGKDYFQYYLRSKLKPILFFDQESKASIVFNDRELKNIILEYDTFLDEVIYTDTTRYINYPYCMIALNKNSFVSFCLFVNKDTMLFRYFPAKGTSTFNLKEGYYEVVYEGRSSYIIRHQSTVVESNGIRDYYYKPIAYLLTGGAYVRVRSSKQLVKILDPVSGEIKNYLRANRIKMRNADKRQIINVLSYYDKLSM